MVEGIHEFELRTHGQVLLENAPLKNAKTFVRIGRKPQVHSRFEIFQLRPAIQNAAERDFQVCLEKKCEVGQGREAVNVTHPRRRTAAHNVARISGEHVSVAQHKVSCA
jgi:hypothetical protein